jgi:glutamate-1-semialdehyde aminotransferase
MEHLARPGDDPRRVAHPGTHNAHPLSAAAGIAALRRCRSGEAAGARGRARRLTFAPG